MNTINTLEFPKGESPFAKFNIKSIIVNGKEMKFKENYDVQKNAINTLKLHGIISEKEYQILRFRIERMTKEVNETYETNI